MQSYEYLAAYIICQVCHQVIHCGLSSIPITVRKELAAIPTITVAKTAGFCFGVDRAVNLVYSLLDEGKKVNTLGPIIHNPQLVADLERRGARSIDRLADADPGATVVIRSHGVGAEVYDELARMGLSCADATCPFVAKIHRIVSEHSAGGTTVLIAGDAHHPEVEGIRGHCKGESYTFKTPEELTELLKKLTKNSNNDIIMVAQTTFSTILWKTCVEIAKKHYTNIKIFDTICNATNERQSEAISLAKQSDLMIIIGGKHSSNTVKLQEVCSRYCKAILIETKDELDKPPVVPSGKIGVTAGASTPAYIIKEVLNTMSEEIRNTENTEEELDFAAMLEQSLNEKIYTGKRVKGIVTAISPNEVQVDVGAKQAGFIPVSELSDDPNAKPEDIVQKDQEIEAIVLKVNDQEGTVMLSKKRCDAEAGFDEIQKAYDEGTVLDGVVTDAVRGGILVLCNSVKIFVPASQAADRRVENLEELVKKPVQFKIIEIKENRRRAVGSIKAVLREQRSAKAEEFWQNVEVGKTYKGEVKSLTSFGAFVDLGGVDGLIHITELSWKKIKHPSEVVNVGDIVEVYIKDINEETKKISLGYKKTEDDPWEIFKKDYAVGQTVNVKIVSITQFGAFAEIIPGVDGLIHISQIANQRVNKVGDLLSVGQTADAKIIDIDTEKKRISLSIRALLEEAEAAEQAAQAQTDLPEGIELTTDEPAPVEETTTAPDEVPAVEDPAATEEVPGEE